MVIQAPVGSLDFQFTASDTVTASNARKSDPVFPLLDLPADTLDRITSHLFEISPASIGSIYLASKRFHNIVSVKAGVLALQCRHIRQHKPAEYCVPIQTINEKLKACILLEAAARMLPIIEISRMLVGHEAEVQEEYHYRLWVLAESLKPLPRSRVLQWFIQATSFFPRETASVWFEDCHETIRDENLPEQPKLYELLATALGFLPIGEIRIRFENVLQGVRSLSEDEQVLSLARLVRSSITLPDNDKDRFFQLAMSRIDPENYQASIRILSAAMHYAKEFSDEQHQVMEKHALAAMPALYDHAVMKEFMLDRGALIAATHVDLRLEAFVSTLDLIEANRSFMTFNRATDQREWQYTMFASMGLCHTALPQNVDSYHAIKRVARHLPLRFEGAIAQETFGDQLSRRGADVNMIIRDMFARCKEMYLRKLRVDVF